jgi:hypothetical protein
MGVYGNLDFNPSGSNLFDFHLMSDSSNLESNHNGYFVRVGGSDDEISLFRKSGSSDAKIIDGPDNRVNLDPVSNWVKVLRFGNGDWKVYSRLESDSTLVSEGAINDLTFTTSASTGLVCDYTSSRSTLFWFDDFGYNQAPKAIELIVVDSNTLSVEFNEQLENSSAINVSNYSVDGGIGNPNSVIVSSIDPPIVELVFTNSFVLANSYDLTINNVADTLDHSIAGQVLPFECLQFSTPGFGELVFNEIMADPPPTVGLPEIELVEIFNPTDDYFDISLLFFSDPTTIGSVSTQEIIEPLEYIILCDEDDTASFSSFGRVIGLSAFPGLNNDGDVLSLFVDSVLIDKITSSSAWYGDDDKGNGGYTLEQINPNSPCQGVANWVASLRIRGDIQPIG